MKRPELTKEIIRTAVDRVFTDDQYNDSERNAITEAFSSGDNGYELMKKLEDDFWWDASVELVNELDSLDHQVDRAYNEHIKQWEIDNNIQPPYQIGHKFTRNGEKLQITEIDRYRPYSYCAKYLERGECTIDHYRVVWFDEVGDK